MNKGKQNKSVGTNRQTAEAGLFKQVWEEGLLTYDEVQELGWEWQSVDGCMLKAPLSQEAAGNNPTDKRKL